MWFFIFYGRQSDGRLIIPIINQIKGDWKIEFFSPQYGTVRPQCIEAVACGSNDFFPAVSIQIISDGV